jgi:hypothetical protein
MEQTLFRRLTAFFGCTVAAEPMQFEVNDGHTLATVISAIEVLVGNNPKSLG